MDLQISFISQIFKELDANHIKYCVLRNYEGLPKYCSSNDVDILIDRNNLRQVYSILQRIAEAHRVHALFYNSFQYTKAFTFFYHSENKRMFSLKIDFIFNFEARGAIFLNANEIHSKRIYYKNFYAIDSVQEAIINWLKPLITGGIVKTKYKEKIYRVIISYPEDFKFYMGYILGSKLTAKLWPFLASGNIERTLEYANEIRRKSWLISFGRKPVSTIAALLLHIYIEVKRRFFPKKQMIVIIGPDGTGKSTVIERLKDRVCDLMKWDIAKIKICHFRPHILPNLKKLVTFWRKDVSREDFTNPHRARPSSFLFSLFRLMYYLSDYILGYYFKLRWMLGKHYIFLFDRYYYDFIVDPARSRIKLPKVITMLFLKIIPKPTLTVLIDNDVNTILSRKKELRPAEIDRQLSEYRSLVRKIPNAIIVDGRQPIIDIVETIAEEYVKKIAIPIESMHKYFK